MQVIQKAYKINNYSTEHTIPDMTKEVKALADMFEKEAIQIHVANWQGNSTKSCRCDLLFSGSLYANVPQAFHDFHLDTRQMENLEEEHYKMRVTKLSAARAMVDEFRTVKDSDVI